MHILLFTRCWEISLCWYHSKWKHPMELFYKISSSWKFSNIHRKIPMLESRLIKLFSTEVFSCEYSEIFKNNYFEKHLRTAASQLAMIVQSKEGISHIVKIQIWNYFKLMFHFYTPLKTFSRRNRNWTLAQNELKAFS